MRVWLDKVASATGNVPLRRDARLTDQIIAREGYIIAGCVHGEKTTYNQLEDLHGRMVTVHEGDIIAGVLGRRNALHGYSGYVPDSIAVGDRLQLLNLGGIIGRCTSENPDVGRPFDVEVLGAVLVFPDFEDRSGVPAHIKMSAIEVSGGPLPTIPVVYVAGTCMNSGKTTVACQLIRQLSRQGRSVGACKLTGVSLRRDTLQMSDHGARWAVSFTDAGIASTSAENSVPVARALFSHLAQSGADVIVAELGDGILGEYGVAEILGHEGLRSLAAVTVVCANDPVGVWGAQRIMQQEFALAIDVVSGPATDNAVGIRYVTTQLGLEAINARTHGAEIGQAVARRLATHRTQVSA